MPAWPDRLFSVGVWAISTLLLLAFVVRFGSSLPWLDDYFLIPRMHEALQTADVAWLWELTNDHRQPLGKLLQSGVWVATGGNLRAGMVFGAITAAFGAAVLMALTAAVRGRLQFTDAVYPLLLLNLGHAMLFLFYFLASQVLCSLILPFACAALIAAAVTQQRWTIWLAIAMCALAPFSGTPGIAALPAVVPGLATLYLSLPDRRRWRFPLGLAVAICLAVFVLFFVGHSFVDRSDGGNAGLTSMVWRTLKAWASAFGPVALKQELPFIAATVAVTALAGVVMLLEATRRRVSYWATATVILAIGAGLSTGTAIGVFRSGNVQHYYCFSTIVGLSTVYLALVAARGSGLARIGQLVIFTLVCMGTLYHASLGFEVGRTRVADDAAFQRDVAAGVPLTMLAAKHRDRMATISTTEERFGDAIGFLKGINQPGFDEIRPDPAGETIAVDDAAVSVRGATQTGDRWTCEDGRTTIEIEAPRAVAAFRCRFRPLKSTRDVHWTILPMDADCASPVERQTGTFRGNVTWSVFDGVHTIWLDEPLARLVVTLDDCPPEFELDGITLLANDDGAR